jgi:hypothetical protein
MFYCDAMFATRLEAEYKSADTGVCVPIENVDISMWTMFDERVNQACHCHRH